MNWRFFALALAYCIWIIAGLYSLESHAVTCPLPSPQFDQLLSDLQSFKTQLKPTEQCKSLSNELTHLEAFYSGSSRGLFERINRVDNKGNKIELAPDEIEQFRSSTQALSSKIESIVGALGSRKDCYNEDKRSGFLETLAGLTQQTSMLTAQFAGPYGIPLGLGGALLSGALRGIYRATHNADYENFKHVSNRQLYVRNLCTYENIRNELSLYLDRDRRLTQLKTLEDSLLEKRRRLVAEVNCKTCNQLWQKLTLQDALDLDLDFLRLKFHDVEELVDKNVWDACSQTFDMVASATMFTKEFSSKYQTNLEADVGLSELFRMIQDQTLTIKQCYDPNRSEKLLRQTLRANLGLIKRWKLQLRNVFRNQAQQMINTCRPEGFPNTPLECVYLANTHLNFYKLKWTIAEYRKATTTDSQGSSSSYYSLGALSDEIKSRILGGLAPQFLKWHLDQAKDAGKSLENNIKSQIPAITKLLAENLPGSKTEKGQKKENSVLKEYLSLISRLGTMKGLTSNTVTRIYPLTRDFVGSYLRITSSLAVLKQYCNYHKLSGSYYPQIVEQCESKEQSALLQQATQAKSVLDEIYHFSEIWHKDGLIEADSYEALIKEIKECYLKIPDPTPTQQVQ